MNVKLDSEQLLVFSSNPDFQTVECFNLLYQILPSLMTQINKNLEDGNLEFCEQYLTCLVKGHNYYSSKDIQKFVNNSHIPVYVSIENENLIKYKLYETGMWSRFIIAH